MGEFTKLSIKAEMTKVQEIDQKGIRLRLTTLFFDMGNVLLEFNPRNIVSHFTQDAKTINYITPMIFGHQEWLSLDLGTITDDEAILSICARVDSTFHPLVTQIVKEWPVTNYYYESMIPLVNTLKNRGMKLYLLSNASIKFHTYKKDIRALDVFDGIVISADIHKAKPDPAFYETVLTQLKLDRSECFMIDDMKANIEGAAQCGIKGTIYTGDIKALEQTLTEKGIL
ncbi:MAG: haloacid dehalogenase superfamily subfamily IA variant 3 with third motif having DD or [Erysipelotrichaceae bacterium]|nr:MAG: haloacid dehalogenase superfamily subfamily IA variant 3 with third motif having DD or [Erysipelotrichaceae bacterium]